MQKEEKRIGIADRNEHTIGFAARTRRVCRQMVLCLGKRTISQDDPNMILRWPLTPYDII